MRPRRGAGSKTETDALEKSGERTRSLQPGAGGTSGSAPNAGTDRRSEGLVPETVQPATNANLDVLKIVLDALNAVIGLAGLFMAWRSARMRRTPASDT